MKYAVEMGSGALMYIPSFIKIGSGIQKLIGGIHIQTHELMGEIYEVRHLYGYMYHDIYTKFYKD
jgi:hypothetical protein